MHAVSKDLAPKTWQTQAIWDLGRHRAGRLDGRKHCYHSEFDSSSAATVPSPKKLGHEIFFRVRHRINPTHRGCERKNVKKRDLGVWPPGCGKQNSREKHVERLLTARWPIQFSETSIFCPSLRGVSSGCKEGRIIILGSNPTRSDPAKRIEMTRPSVTDLLFCTVKLLVK